MSAGARRAVGQVVSWGEVSPGRMLMMSVRLTGMVMEMEMAGIGSSLGLGPRWIRRVRVRVRVMVLREEDADVDAPSECEAGDVQTGAFADDAQPDDPSPDDRLELMERLCGLVERLSVSRLGGELEMELIDVLHAKVDEMEEVLWMAEDVSRAEAAAQAEAEAEAEAEMEVEADADADADANRNADADAASATAEVQAQAEKARSEPGSESEDKTAEGTPAIESGELSGTLPQLSLPRRTEQYVFDLGTTPSWLAAPMMMASQLSISPTRSPPELAAATNQALEAAKQAAQAQAEAAERVAVEAQKVSSKLEKVVKSLVARKEESDHLHSMLVERAEAAASRILDLEKEVTDLEDDILANESELRHLRLEIRAIETLCHEFVPIEADPVLFESIENWKADWVLVRDRMLERKKGRKDRRLRLHRAGSLLDANAVADDGGDGESTLTSLGGLSMSVSMFGIKSSPRKG
ncbi:hypothetical protein N656DRAFT_402063 [Canariomyces notabilis]|uniref:Uncharacterized protein n=1 Tax=Canariomyces notabilis TaxID=2074819 RepID=A0AAN6YWT4_9PEZI|nr:hypothetical protein N656DRAFT_402063 [Canariomyces arenarius]